MMTEPFTQAGADKKVFTAGEDDAGRLDSWLAQRLAGIVSRNRVQALIGEGRVIVNDHAAREARTKIRPGDVIEIELPEPEPALPQPQEMALDILYEDEDLIVLVKQAGLVVHPGAGNPAGTLVNALLHHCGESLSGIGGVRRPGIVHRLDKDTSGVMVVAKNDRAHRHLSEQFADHGLTGALQRAYLALVWGCPSPLKGTIDAPLGRSDSDRTRRTVKRDRSPDSRHAVTHYTVRQRFGTDNRTRPVASLVECRLETGRTHQIRVHLAHIGHPLVGDQDYGASHRTKVNTLPEELRGAISGFHRQALHAFLLQFEHPRTGRIMRFEASLPEDMDRLISDFGTLKGPSPASG
jgi:23S rRNA pseudouridine1911/1915/1917 synthase